MILNIPTSLSEVSVDQWMALQATDDPIKHVSILCNVPEDVVRNIEAKSMDRVSVVLSDLDAPAKSKWPLVPKLTIGDALYAVLPNISELSVGEFADLETACQDVATDPRRFLSILYRRVVEDHKTLYRIAEYTGFEPVEPMGQVPVSAFYGLLDFFLTIGTTFTKASLQSLKEEQEASSLKSGAGMQSSIISPMARR